MGKETETQGEDTRFQILQNLIAVIGLGFIAYVMWPDVREQVENTINSGIEAYTVFIICYFAFVVLVLFLAIVGILMWLWLWKRGRGDWHRDEYQFVDEEIDMVIVASNDKHH